MATPYLLIMRGDIEPEAHGPFETEKERDAQARSHRREHGLDDGVFAVDIDWAAREFNIWSYSSGFIREGGK